jgi:hypothetical protein
VCLDCGTLFELRGESDWLDEDPESRSETDLKQWLEHCRERERQSRPYTHVRDALNQQFPRLRHEGVLLPADIVSELKSAKRDSDRRGVIEERMLEMSSRHAGGPAMFSKDGKPLAGPGYMDPFSYNLHLLDGEGFNKTLLAELWKLYPGDSEAMGLPEPDEIAAVNPASGQTTAVDLKRLSSVGVGGDNLPQGSQSEPFAISTDGRSVKWTDHPDPFEFTPMQAKCFEFMFTNWKSGTPVLAQETILENAGASVTRLSEIFTKGKHPAWGTLIVPGKTKGTFRLKPDLPLKREHPN